MFQTADMLRIFNAHRGDAIVVPGRGARHWQQISTRPTRDVPLGDPAMGGHAGFALGLALARPADRVVLFDSDYWGEMVDWIRAEMLADGLVSPADLELLHVTDDPSEAVQWVVTTMNSRAAEGSA